MFLFSLPLCVKQSGLKVFSGVRAFVNVSFRLTLCCRVPVVLARGGFADIFHELLVLLLILLVVSLIPYVGRSVEICSVQLR